MHKYGNRIWLFVVFVAWLFLLSACGQQALPQWLPEDMAQSRPAGWEADFSAGELTRVSLSTGTEALTYHPGEALSRGDKTSNLGDTRLTCGQLPGILEGISDWMEQNQPQLMEQEFSCSFVDPRFYFQGSPKGVTIGSDGRLLGYSLSSGKLTVLSGAYSGSQEYGAVTLFTQDGNWNVLIDQ